MSSSINSTFSGRPSPGGVIVVRAEEALIVIFVLILWIAAIALFFNRWGKIRMLEPYQPKFQQQQHRSSCALIDSTSLRTGSKFNIHCVDHPQCQLTTPRPRQNSVFVGSNISLLGGNIPRRTKSAFDLQSLFKDESNPQEQQQQQQQPPQPPQLPLQQQQQLLLQLHHQPLQKPVFSAKEKELEVSGQMNVKGNKFQRERGHSICQFDRTRPLLRDRGMSICHFDRMDVLARPIFRGSRANIFTNAEKLEFLGRSQKGSNSNIDASSNKYRYQKNKHIFETNNLETMSDQPSCSKTLVGYQTGWV